MRSVVRIPVLRLLLATSLLIGGVQPIVFAQSAAQSDAAAKSATAAKPRETDPDNEKIERGAWRTWIPRVEMQDWMPLYSGVDEAKGMIDGHFHSVFYAVRVDLQAPGISVVGTPHSGSKATVSETVMQFATERGVQVAVNGGYFFPCCATTPEEKGIHGLQITDGKVVTQVSPEDVKKGFDVALVVTKDNQASIRRMAPDADMSNIYTAATGNKWLVQNAEVDPQLPIAVSMDGPKKPDTAPRTAVGVSKDGRYLYLLTIDGRVREYSMGTTYRETAYVMLALGAYNALNLDGGGSTTLVEQDARGKLNVINRPSDKHERLDANSLGVHALPLPPKSEK